MRTYRLYVCLLLDGPLCAGFRLACATPTPTSPPAARGTASSAGDFDLGRKEGFSFQKGCRKGTGAGSYAHMGSPHTCALARPRAERPPFPRPPRPRPRPRPCVKPHERTKTGARYVCKKGARPKACSTNPNVMMLCCAGSSCREPRVQLASWLPPHNWPCPGKPSSGLACPPTPKNLEDAKGDPKVRQNLVLSPPLNRGAGGLMPRVAPHINDTQYDVLDGGTRTLLGTRHQSSR